MERKVRRGISGAARAAAVLGVASALLAGAASARAESTGADDSQPWIGNAAPDFKLETVAGDSFALADMRGRWLVVHFGASW